MSILVLFEDEGMAGMLLADNIQDARFATTENGCQYNKYKRVDISLYACCFAFAAFVSLTVAENIIPRRVENCSIFNSPKLANDASCFIANMK